MKRVLIITYYWPPSGGSGVQRWVKFAKYLPQEGWTPVIYTPRNPELLVEDDCLESEIPEQAEILKTTIFEPYGIYHMLFGKKKEVNPINSQKKSLKQKIALYIRSNVFVPDPRIHWVRPSAHYLKRYLKKHPVDVIISTGPPHSMHLIAQRVSRSTGIPWIADFRDPWTKMFYFKDLNLSKRNEKKHYALEQSVLDDADIVVSVSPLVQNDFAQMTDTPVELITNGFDEEDFSMKVSSNGLFNIVHTGFLASDGNPVMLWRVLSLMCRKYPEFQKKLCIRLVGKTDVEIIDSLYEYGLEKNYLDVGYKSHMEANCEQLAATMLIMPLRKAPEYRKTLPGKIFEYLASKRPVLGIGQEDGAAAKILRQTGSGVMYDWNNEEGISLFLENEWALFQSGQEDRRGGDIQAYSRRFLTGKLVRLMDALIEK